MQFRNHCWWIVVLLNRQFLQVYDAIIDVNFDKWIDDFNRGVVDSAEDQTRKWFVEWDFLGRQNDFFVRIFNDQVRKLGFGEPAKWGTPNFNRAVDGGVAIDQAIKKRRFANDRGRK